MASLVLWFYIKIKVFLLVNAQLGCLDVSGVPQAHFHLLLIGLKRFFGHQHLLPIGWKNLQRVGRNKRKFTNKTPLTHSY
jgi:hypothetical protein